MKFLVLFLIPIFLFALASKALNQIMKTFNKVKEYDLNSGRKKAEELGKANE